MNDQVSLNNIDSLLFQLALQTRELSQKKNDISQQVKVVRADIAERRSYIETLRRNIEKLEEEIRVKQSLVQHNKENAKSMKATNGLLLQFEHTLKEELESRKASYSHDMEVYEEKIASYKKIYQLHRQHYCQNPLAQKLLTLQAEKEEVESRIKACDDQIKQKQMELDHLSGLVVNSFSIEKLPDSISDQQSIAELEKQINPDTEEDSDSSIDISSLHLNQTEPEQISQNGHKTSEDTNAQEVRGENDVQDTTVSNTCPKEGNDGPGTCQQLDEQRRQDGMQTEEQDQETEPDDQGLEQQSTVSEMEEAVEQEEMEETVAIEAEQLPSKEDEGVAALPESSCHGTNLSSPATVKAVAKTPTFPFNFSPGGSPHHETSDNKSPAFLFTLNSDLSTPGFSGFGFDEGSTQDEDSSFTFTGSFFNDKKTTEPKSSSCPEFLFGQQAQSEDFQFAFMSKSPQTTDKDNTGDEFPFSFNF